MMDTYNAIEYEELVAKLEMENVAEQKQKVLVDKNR